MKFVLLSIFVLLATQPVPVVACDMSAGQQTDHGAHGAMSDQRMDHDNSQDMDCCDHDSNDPEDDCAMVQCGTCPAGLAGIGPSILDPVVYLAAKPRLPLARGLLTRSDSPPFRPPIA